MPPSQLRGAPSVTTYVYDEQGRVARTVTRSPWTEEDRALFLALASYEESLCACGCGEPSEQSHHPDNDGWYEVLDDEFGGATICYARAAIEQWEADHKKADLPAGLIPVLSHDRDYEAKPLPAERVHAQRRRPTKRET